MDQPAGRLTFRLLGAFEARRDDQPIELGGPQQRAVLAHLLLQAGHVVPVDALITRVWGDDPPAAALGTLQSYVSRLRRALEPDRAAGSPARVLASEAPGYVLRVDRDDVDVFRFEALAEQGRAAADAGDPAAALARFDEALHLWRGPALAGMAGEHSVEPAIVRLEEGRAAVVEDRFDAELALGRHASMIGPLQEAVAQQPLRERLWAQLALAQYRAGRQADATRTLSAARATLADELGLDPGPELQRLEVQILNHDAALSVAPRPAAEHPAPSASVTAAPGPPTTQPSARRLVGRRHERQVLTTALDAVTTGSAAVVLIDGEAGIGKTALLDELHRDARDRGWSVAWGRCVEGDMAPALWPWIEALRALVDDVFAPAQAALLDGLPAVQALIGTTPTATVSAASSASFHLADQIVAALSRLADAEPLVVVLDDLHWADEASLELVTLVAPRLGRTRVVLAGAHRHLDLGDQGPLATALGALARLNTVRRLSLSGLGTDDVGAMMQAAGTASTVVADDAVVARMHERTGGNPFFIGELTRLLVSEGTGPSAGTVPTGVRDVVRRRLARLPERSLEVLAVAAVIGPEIDLRLLTVATGLAADRCLDDLDPAVVTRVLVPADAGRFRFGHALVRDAVLDDLSPLRLARLHQRAAAAIERVFGDERDQAEPVAAHRWAAGAVDDPAVVVDAQLGAAVVARSRAAMTGAAALIERAFDAALAMPSGPERERREETALELMFSLERSWLVIGRGELAGRTQAAAQRLGTPIARQIVHFLHFGPPADEGRVSDAEPIARLSLELAAATGLPKSWVFAHYMAGVHDWLAGRLSTSVEHFAACAAAWSELAHPALDRPAWATAIFMPTNVLGLGAVVHALTGRDAETTALYAEMDTLLATLDSPTAAVSIGLYGAMAAAVQGDAAAARRWATMATEASSRLRVFHLSPAATVLAGWAAAAIDPGRPVDSAMTAALEEIDASTTRTGLPMLWSLLAQVHAWAGELGDAGRALERATAEAAHRGELWWQPETLRLQAEVLAAAGAPADRVAARAAAAVALADQQGSVRFAIRARTTAADRVGGGR